MQEHILLSIVLLLTLTVLLVSISRRFHIPPILNYIFVGVIVGPFGIGLVESEENIHFLAEFGIVFLLFAIGLEFSLSQMMAMRRAVFGFGSLQVLGTGLIIYLLSHYLFELSFNDSLVVASAIALSSTAIVIKQLTEQSEIQTRHGRATVGILIFQDIMAIPLLILIPALGMSSSPDALAGELGMAFIQGMIVVIVMLLVGRYLLRPLFKEVASSKSQEIFTLTVLTVVLGAAAFTEEMGISMTLGAFLAGMMLGETEYRHQIEADIRPFQDILLGLFFITVGMMISFATLAEYWPYIILLTLGIMLFKASMILAIMRLGFKKNTGISFRTAISLAQVGEFGLVLLTLALSYGLLNDDLGQILLSAGVMSMLITPFIIKYNGLLAKRCCGESYTKNIDSLITNIEQDAKFLSEHVVLLGFGRTGQTTAKFLEQSNVPFIALDMDIQRVHEAQTSGERVYFGHSTNKSILEATNLKRAKAVIITFNEYHAALKTLTSVKSLHPDLPVIIRTMDDTYIDELLEAGATEVVPDSFEASIMLASHLLLSIGQPAYKVIKLTRDARKDRYRILDGIYAGESDDPKDLHALKGLIHSVVVDENAYQVGRRLNETPFDEWNILVKAVKRGSVRGENPDSGTRIRVNDILVLQGQPEDIAKAENWINSGKV